MHIHKFGFTVALKALVFFMVIDIIIGILIPMPEELLAAITLATFFFWVAIILFFRVPRRPFQSHPDNGIVCPADGKVVVIEKTQENEYFQDERLQVSIYMSLLNVHVNWFPIAGVVKYVKYHTGKYLVAFHPKSSELNERNSVVIENQYGAVLMRQIAGFVARKILCFVKAGESFEIGSQVGLIKFGSRVDLFLPLDTRLNVKLNQKVRAGKTLIGSF
jgi:phosphatidylserine decarboxylase